MLNLNDDAVSTSDTRQPFHVLSHGAVTDIVVIDQHQWNYLVHGGSPDEQ